MADKEACVYIVDVSQHMAAHGQGRRKTNLEWALDYFWDRISSTIATERKTLLAGVLAVGTDGTDTSLGDQDGYRNNTTLLTIQQPLLSHVNQLRRRLVVNRTYAGDPISAIVIAIHDILVKCKALKYIKKIVLLTSGEGSMHTEDIDGIVKKLNNSDIKLTILGVDFDDADFGFKEGDKPAQKARNEATLRDLCTRVNGNYGTLAEAIEEMQQPRIKIPRSVAQFKGLLTLGNPAQYETAIKIDVERFLKTSKAKVPSATSWVLNKDNKDTQSSNESKATLGRSQDAMQIDSNPQDLVRVRQVRDYRVPDADAPGGEKLVDRETLAKGYMYGRTIVPISASEETITTLETSPGLDILGFIPKENLPPWFGMSNAYTILPMKGNPKAALALSSFIHALEEWDTVAIARLVEKVNRPPSMRVIAPIIKPDFECLVDVELPFTEDVRNYPFPPLNTVTTISGKKLTEHRNLPSRDLQSAMDDWVESMDISAFDKDEDGNPDEYAKLEDTYATLLHRINQALAYRAVHPDEEMLPEPYPVLAKYSRPPPELVKSSQQQLDRLRTVADIKTVPPKRKGRRTREEVKPLSGLDVQALLAGDHLVKISDENPIPEFKRLLDAADTNDKLKSAAKQMGDVIERRIRTSFADKSYARASEEIRAFRQEMIAMEEPDIFNQFVRNLKTKLLKERLGGDRKEMWQFIRGQRLGLVTKKQSPISEVDREEANSFLWGN